LGAAGHWRGALRYLRTWGAQVLGLLLAGLVIAAALHGITPSP
jgi:hypothetical protein